MAEIETLLLANHVEARDGLLYVSGGGWTDCWRTVEKSGQAPSTHLGIAVSVLVPWREASRSHRLALRIESENGVEVANVDGDFVMGRPPTIPEGADQRAIFAVNADVIFAEAGSYRIVAALDAATKPRVVSFRVRNTP